MCFGPEIAFAIQAIAATTAVAGTAYGIAEGQQAADASKRAEELRKKQLRLKQQEQQRQAIRESQLARANSASNIVGQTGTLEGSIFANVASANSAALGTNLGGINAAANIGLGIFDANAAYAQASANASAGQNIAAFGKDLFNSGPAIGRIGSTLFNGTA